MTDELVQESQWDTRVDHEETSAEYWTRINVTNHKKFKSVQESVEYFHWRNMMYSNYIELMPVHGFDGKSILDYGCGPGHDIVGFAVFSKPSRLIGMDVSPTSLSEAAHRLQLHTANVEFMHIREGQERLPIADQSIDLIHSSGVLHHISDPLVPLREFRRVIKPGGHCQIMIYNYLSVFVHIGIAFNRKIQDKYFADLFKNCDLAEAFKRTTDGDQCPVSRYYKPDEFIALWERAGFKGGFRGAGVSTWEMQLLQSRFDALTCLELADEHRRFIYDLTFDEKQRPIFNGHIAGIDGVFEFHPV
jgi:ubiquinone/menaquinone biosynthesis C-methylase UbiE